MAGTVRRKRISQIKGWGDTKKDCVDFLSKRPELRRQGYRTTKLGNTWIVGK